MCEAQRAHWKGKLSKQCNLSFLSMWPTSWFLLPFPLTSRELANSLHTLCDKSEVGFDNETLWTWVERSNHSDISAILDNLKYCFIQCAWKNLYHNVAAFGLDICSTDVIVISTNGPVLIVNVYLFLTYFAMVFLF